MNGNRDDQLSRSAARVQAVLDGKGVSARVVELPASTRTAPEAAEAVGCDVAQIAKSLVFRGKQTGRPVLVIASGANRVNEKRIGRELGEKIAKADADFVREHTGFAIGGVPPVGHAVEPVTFIDKDLLALGRIYAAAGTPNALFELEAEDLPELTGGNVTAVTGD